MRVVLSLCAAVALASPATANPAATRTINALRADYGLPALQYDPQLERAAGGHAQDMLDHRHFSHSGSDGSTVAERVSQTGYQWCFVAENIAQGYPDLAQVLNAWMQSPGHRANMLSPKARDFAVLQGGGYIWVMVLAAKHC